MASKNNRDIKFFFPINTSDNNTLDNLDSGPSATGKEDKEGSVDLSLSQSSAVMPLYRDIRDLSNDELKNENIKIKLLQEIWPDCQRFLFLNGF